MNSDQKTLLPSLIDYINSDLFTLDNISTSVTLQVENTDSSLAEWDAVISYLPLKFFQIIESYPGMYTTEVFDKKYKCKFTEVLSVLISRVQSNE